MRALQYEVFGGPLAVVERPDPTPPDDGVVVAVAASGLCRSDWHGWQGHDPDITTLPHVPGHEFAGTIVAVGRDVRSWTLGRRVTAPFVFGCGRCDTCRGGDPQVCPHQWQPGFHGPGTHATLVALPRADANLVAVPDGVDLDMAALLGCRFTTAWRAVVDRARVGEGDWLAVHGIGGVGASAVVVAVARGVRVVALDPDPARRDLARSLGAAAVVDPAAEDALVAVRDHAGGGTAASIDAIGHPAVVDLALRALAIGGRHVQVGLLPDGAHVPMEVVVGRELQVLGSHGQAAGRFAEVWAAIADGTIDLSRLRGSHHDLDQARDLVTHPERLGPGFAVVHPTGQ